MNRHPEYAVPGYDEWKTHEPWSGWWDPREVDDLLDELEREDEETPGSESPDRLPF